MQPPTVDALSSSTLSDHPDKPTSALPPTSQQRPKMERSLTGLVSEHFGSSKALVDDQFSGLTLLDLFVVLEAHLDLLGRRLKLENIKSKIKDTSREWRSKAEESYAGLKSKADEVLSKRSISFTQLTSLNSPDLGPQGRQRKETPALAMERELANLKAKMARRVERFQQRWNDASSVSRREKWAFMFGVMNVLGSALLIGFRPQWIPLVYTLQSAWLMPVRIYTYRQKNFHYFLLDNCYYINLICLIYIWFFPGSARFFQVCYAMSHGPLLTAIVTWRNSLVFHSLEKVTSLFIHIYPSFTFTTIVHFYPDAGSRFPALTKLDRLRFVDTMVLTSFAYLVWQVLYWYFVIVKRKEKIEKGGRVTSFTYLLNNPKGVIGWIASWFKPSQREHAFMVFQYLYTIISMLPVFWLYKSTVLSGTYLILCFAVSVWNGACFYLDVFSRRFDKELIKLRQELETLQQESANRSVSEESTGADRSVGISPMVLPIQEEEEIPPLHLQDATGDEADQYDDASSGELVEFSEAEGEMPVHGHDKQE